MWIFAITNEKHKNDPTQSYIFTMASFRTALFTLVFAILHATNALTPPPTNQGDECLVKSCCEEDCCGLYTTWDPQRGLCVNTFPSGPSGFNGTYSENYVPGCVPRVCCEAECCQYWHTYWANASSSCIFIHYPPPHPNQPPTPMP